MEYYFSIDAVYNSRYSNSASQVSVILAIPVILGSVLRVPFGYLTNIIGAKWVFLAVLLFCYFLYSFGSKARQCLWYVASS